MADRQGAADWGTAGGDGVTGGLSDWERVTAGWLVECLKFLGGAWGGGAVSCCGGGGYNEGLVLCCCCCLGLGLALGFGVGVGVGGGVASERARVVCTQQPSSPARFSTKVRV